MTVYPAAFQKAMEILLKHEGEKFTNDPADSGGATKFGITLRTYRNDADPGATIDTIRNLTRDQAIAYYYKHWWQRGPYDEIATPDITVKLFNIAVNVGQKRANVLCQRALRACGIAIAEDGIIGMNTISALRVITPSFWLAAFRAETAGHYRLLAETRPKDERFLNGWLTRAYS
ncbi:hypothetical protein VF14_18350 [Nostoc linckia z18]|uniref:Peptidoglycan domain protein n=2 Tax=Nostoc linckia TaxID=92942 RepID=A0A9Q5Z942_NOSLI|nr:glycosyl hydrolase 108 family protein [Nostoc linckia]PHJ53463.1 hypothetical protein VF02_37235 [Nostoc linckia z1]PHJ81969.1 hypothetical protein VF07_29180 [Nostoc linckia z6]PHJ92867.1 hypothetical protein VF04_27895 [Nostoc linckia z7]PHK00810.1 hypothetical protein VF08_23350 [Nostoc linckia z8]PHK09312.1 hypothetical protein VF09_15955 [Nostoc linckia z9]